MLPVVVGAQSLRPRDCALSSGTYASVYCDRFHADKVIKILSHPITRQAAIRDVTLGAWFIAFPSAFPSIIPHQELIYDGRSKKWGIVMMHGGEDLETYLRKHKKTMGREERLAITSQILLMLYNLHLEAGLVHRDLKPANLLWSVKRRKLYVIDFNLSCFAGSPKRRSSTVQTRWYRAPEVILGSKTYTQAIDVWSTGVILLYLWTGYLGKSGSALEQLWLCFALGGSPLPLSSLRHLPRWKTLVGQDEHRMGPLWPYGFLDLKLCTVADAGGLEDDIRWMIKEMLVLDPAKRVSIGDLFASEAAARLFAAAGVRPERPCRTPSTISFPPIPCDEVIQKDLDEMLQLSLKHNVGFGLAPEIWFGLTTVLFSLAWRVGKGRWSHWKVLLPSIHAVIVGAVEDDMDCLEEMICRYGTPPSEEGMTREIVEILKMVPQIVPLYFSHPWCVAVRMAKIDSGRPLDLAAPGFAAHGQTLLRQVAADTFRSLRGNPRLYHPEYTFHLSTILADSDPVRVEAAKLFFASSIPPLPCIPDPKKPVAHIGGDTTCVKAIGVPQKSEFSSELSSLLYKFSISE